MADYITSENLEFIVKQNEEIRQDVESELFLLLSRYNLREGIKSEEKFAINILKQHGLIQIPIENKYWGGAIYFIDDKVVPVINTALPRANQYFIAWHEVYHLMYGKRDAESIYEVSTELNTAERKADYFAARALLGNVYNYYVTLNKSDFLDRIALCMDLYRVPYKAVLIQLYEDAKAAGNKELTELIFRNFDLKNEDWVKRFRKLGLDEELVTPSYVLNLSYLEEKINEQKELDMEVSAHEYNLQYLEKLKKQIKNDVYKGAAMNE